MKYSYSQPLRGRYAEGGVSYEGRQYSRQSAIVEPADVEALISSGVPALSEHVEGGVYTLTLLSIDESRRAVPNLQSTGKERKLRKNGRKGKLSGVAELWRAPDGRQLLVLHDDVLTRDNKTLERVIARAEHGDRVSERAGQGESATHRPAH